MRLHRDLNGRKEYLEDLLKLLELMDADRNGIISLEEWVKHVSAPEVAMTIELLGIQVDDAFGLFELLDVDGDAGITIYELIEGFSRLRGQASALDAHRILLRLESLHNKIDTVYSSACRNSATSSPEQLERSRNALTTSLNLGSKADNLPSSGGAMISMLSTR